MRRLDRLRPLVRHLPKLLGIAALGLIIVFMSYGFHSRVGPSDTEHARPHAGNRSIVPVRPLRTTETITSVGTVRPRLKAEVASQVLATILDVPVNPGDRVEAGQVLVTLDDRELQAQLREAEAALRGVEADLAVRERDYSRYKRMFAENAVTKEDFDRIEGAFQMTQAQLQRSQQQVARMRVMLSYTSIKAAESGIVSDRFADPGDLAAPGKPLLAVHDPGQLELHASVPESLAAYLRLEETFRVRVDAAELETAGKVREIVPQAEAASRSVLVKVALPPEARERVYIGMFARLQIPVGHVDRVVVAAQAVQTIGQLDIVDVVADDHTLERRFVRTGERFGDDLEILSGLRVGERVALPAEHGAVAGAASAFPPGHKQ